MAVALLPVTLWRAGTLAAVIAALVAFGIAGGVLDVGINAQGVRLEEACGRPLMASFHACYSLAGLAGAVLGGLLADQRASPLGPLAALALAGIAVTVLAGRHLADGPVAPGAGRPGRGGGWAPGRVDARPLELGLLALCCVICEGATGNWSGVYLHGYAGAPVWLAAAGFAAFSAAMAGGRLAGDRLAARYGPAWSGGPGWSRPSAWPGRCAATSWSARSSASPPAAPGCPASSPNCCRWRAVPTRTGPAQASPAWPGSVSWAWSAARR